MGRPPRLIPAGTIVHVVNRSVDRRRIFHTDRDYWAFVDLLQEGTSKEFVSIFGYCVMPNHWHLLLRALSDSGVSAYMKWLTTTHVRRYRSFYGTVGHGHLYKARFRHGIIADDESFIRALRYVEANAAKADLTARSEDWRWSSAFERRMRHRHILCPPPCQLPQNWCTLLASYVDECRRAR